MRVNRQTWTIHLWRWFINFFQFFILDEEYAFQLYALFLLSQGYLRIIRCCIIVGEVLEADKNLKIVSKLDPTNPSLPVEESNLLALKTAVSNAESSYQNKDYRQVGWIHYDYKLQIFNMHEYDKMNTYSL